MTSIKIYAISDLHSSKRKFEFASKIIKNENPDLLIICGDISHSSRKERLAHVISWLDFEPILFVLGNMDGQELNSQISNAKNINLNQVNYRNYIIYGLGGPNHSLDSIIDSSKDFFSNVNSERLIIISHIPPKNHCDKVYKGEHVGNKRLKNLIQKIQPRLLLCGHIHEDRGISHLNNTIIINVGAAGCIIEINEDDTITYKLIKNQ